MATTAKHRVLAAAASAILATAGVGVPAAAIAAPTAHATTQISPVPQSRECYVWGYEEGQWASWFDDPYDPWPGWCDDQYYDGYADGYYGVAPHLPDF
ncbi:hypothetical protein I6A84_14035 [Frankia sp. CNm7]|uniref:Pili structural subunit n=1 Tax=Frankia nepalensis TaxID=1836974 RepID=A0A937RXA0_9ACTN|nr:hypothetical protein [Frankia nepalensis]MBL7497249.1 hypothetical protein [Frankia nepalensis]MBL7512951.1 hypothetical protein [Frankia nepalensis]MBL7519194.1 hypothetical protein [Frankia nepalensis]MBL7633491.1 hypothetical protein [Frankia nepalensis]